MLGELSQDEKDILERVTARYEAADSGLHASLRERWDEFDGLYNNYSDFKRSWREASENDRDSVLHDGRREFGYELFIPHTFAVVELTLARELAHRPRLIVEPGDRASEPKAESVRWLLEQQMRAIDYELVLQRVGKAALIYNLGVQKTFWQKEERDVRKLEKVAGAWVRSNPYRDVVRDRPMAQSILPYDWFWDPYADSIENCGYAIHRFFRPTSYVLAKLGLDPATAPERTPWPALYGRLTKDEVEGAGARDGFASTWQGRARGEGVEMGRGETIPGESLHEIWEYHDGEQVVVILDKQWPVVMAENQCWRGGLAGTFQVFRPTEVPGRMYGKGAVEPIRDLQLELNQLRTDRRWAAKLKLLATYAYNQDAVDPDDIKIGTGRLVGVQGDPGNVLKELVPGDIPFSSHKEEDALLADFTRTTGLADPTELAGAVSETATGVQMVQQATQVRTRMATRRAALELARPLAVAWLELNQQRILEPVDVRIPAMPRPDAPTRTHDWLAVGPEDLQGSFDIEVQDLSTSAEDIAQRRQDAQIFQALAQDPRLDGRKMLLLTLESLGVVRPEEHLAPDATVPDEALDMIHGALVQQFGLDPMAVKLVMQQVLGQALDAREQAERGGTPTTPNRPQAAQSGQQTTPNGGGAQPLQAVGS